MLGKQQNQKEAV